MALDKQAAEDLARRMFEHRATERQRLDRIYEYLRGTNRFVWLSSKVPDEVRRLADISRVNVLRFIVDSAVQSLIVDGFRTPSKQEDEPAWDLWQRNRLDARQAGVHRAALSYGASYVTVLPGEPVPVLRGASPRKMTVVYGNDDDWPVYALEKRRPKVSNPGEPAKVVYRLFDDEAVYWFESDESAAKMELVNTEMHAAGVTPVVRFLNVSDLDDEVISDVEQHFPLQDQISLTTFGLLVAQHYGAFKQRWVLGWTAESEDKLLKASASKVWTIDKKPQDVQIGQFEETDVHGYIDSREASIRHLATLSQTPVHELQGQLVNLSAEALVAARDSANRKNTGSKTILGESWEQSLELGARFRKQATNPQAEVRWRDMEARSLAQTADALGKLVEMLGIPAEEMWERVPGVSQQELARWRAAKDEPLEEISA